MKLADSQRCEAKLQIIDCGKAHYKEILSYQCSLWQNRVEGKICDTILVVEHYPVITLGSRKDMNKLQIDGGELIRKSIDFVQTNRGGGATAHNPGQLVFYPILNLRVRRVGVNEYVRTLERIGTELLERFNVRAEIRKGYPGLWVGDKKIASIGLRLSRWVTYHGMAVNINNDLSIFDYIVPCGLEGVVMTSVYEQTGRNYSMELVKEKLCEILRKYL